MYTKQIKGIENLIQDYFQGIFDGDAVKLENCFHENAFIYGDIKGADYKKSVVEYVTGVKNRKSPAELQETFSMKIIGIDIMGKIAMVKLHVPLLGNNYYDYLSLTYTNNNWQIVNKIFTHVA